MADERGGEFWREGAEGLDCVVFRQGFEQSSCGAEVTFDEFGGQGLEALGGGHGVVRGGLGWTVQSGWRICNGNGLRKGCCIFRCGEHFGLGLMEVSMWLVVISAVITQIAAKPLLGVFYALGFSVGNVVGILVERRVALGNMSLRVISAARGGELARRSRELGYGVTTFQGEGRSGAVTLLYVVCGRKDFRRALDTVKSVEPGAFYVTEMAGSVGKALSPCA